MAAGRGRGGIRRWREWLHRATHHSAEDDRQLLQAAEQTRRDGDDDRGEPGGPAEAGGSGGRTGDRRAAPRSHASLDQVLQRAAEARASQHDTQR